MLDRLICVRGGGDIATGTIHRLFSAGFKVVVLETEQPAAIRRQVAFCEAVYEGEKTVEGVKAVKALDLEDAVKIIEKGCVPVVVDPKGESVERLKPSVLVDGILAKKNLGTNRAMAKLTIGLGPGFYAGRDVDFVIETKRGHNLGRIIAEGEAYPNTGVPGNIGGYTRERVIHAPIGGRLSIVKGIGEVCEKGEVIATIENECEKAQVLAAISGVIRGMINEKCPIFEGLKIADIDPRITEVKNCFTISDKARCISGGVLELVCKRFGGNL